MLTDHQIRSILANPGSYRYWCVTSPHGSPFWAHARVGHVLHVVTDVERDAFRARAAKAASVS